ncbi:MAG: copper resistance protein CopC/CopD [Steroidobacteraceae bacterium]|nr:copper resistance protein CopC/CopD [Steroidobacteraceae bacterium]MDW8259155.1 copper resistance protein CopC [Gammaproteobacteria bacterium]
MADRRRLRAAAASVLALVPPAVFGHAVLLDSSPKAGQVLETSPTEVSVTFNESVGPIFFRILDRNGKEVGATGEIRLDGTRMSMSLAAPLANGSYVLNYRVISADTHPVGATIPFAIGEPLADGVAATRSDQQTRSGWTVAVAVNRWMLYAAMLLAAGSALFVLLLSAAPAVQHAAYRAGRLAAVIAMAGYVLAIGLGGAEMVLGGASALFGFDAWRRGLQSTLSVSAALGVLAMLLLLRAYRRSTDAPQNALLAAGAALAIASFLVTGHAATAPPVWLMATTVALHLVAAAFWLGSLYPLLQSTLLQSARDSGALFVQFSMRAAYAVAALVVSGLVISWTQLQGFANVFGNDYGQSLLRKLSLFVVLLAIAAYNKWVLMPALLRNDAAASRRIRGSIRIEYCVFVLVIGGAMALTLATPPRALAHLGSASASANGAATRATGVRGTASAAGYTVEYELTPARAGENMLMVTVKDASGQILTALPDLEISPSLESAGIADIRLEGERMSNGTWHFTIREMLIPGDWALGITVFVTDYDKVEFSTTVRIQ